VSDGKVDGRKLFKNRRGNKCLVSRDRGYDGLSCRRTICYCGRRRVLAGRARPTLKCARAWRYRSR